MRISMYCALAIVSSPPQVQEWIFLKCAELILSTSSGSCNHLARGCTDTLSASEAFGPYSVFSPRDMRGSSTSLTSWRSKFSFFNMDEMLSLVGILCFPLSSCDSSFEQLSINEFGLDMLTWALGALFLYCARTV
eukprot:Gb_26915 [translate_table: standard]